MKLSPRILFAALSCVAIFAAMPSSAAFAKGLDELSDAKPEEADPATKAEAGEEGEATDATQEATKEATGTVAATPLVRSASSLAIADKLFIGTSFSRVKASTSEGDWNSSGMSDVTVGYKLPMLAQSATMALYTTYRYAPMAVTWLVDGHSLRGVLEAHYLGSRLNYRLKPTLVALTTLEVGYVAAHMHDTDNLGVDDKYQAGGVSMVLGGGAEWGFGEKSNWTAGPRLNLGFGSFSTVQFGGAVGFMF